MLTTVQAHECALQRTLQRLNGIDYITQDIKIGLHGGKRIKYTNRWNSVEADAIKKKIKYVYDTSAERSLHGFLRLVKSPLTALFFGFEFNKSSFFKDGFVPDVDEINGAIDKINGTFALAGAKDRLLIEYYSVQGRVPPEFFLRKFSNEGLLPIASKGHYFIHDITAHHGINFLPEEMTQLARHQTAALLEFRDYLKSNYPNTHSRIHWKALLEGYASALDFGNANLPLAFHRGHFLADTEINEDLELFVSSFNTPEEFLKKIIENKIDAQNIGEISEALKEFSEKKRATDPEFTKSPRWNVKTFKIKTRERIKKINKAVKKAIKYYKVPL